MISLAQKNPFTEMYNTGIDTKFDNIQKPQHYNYGRFETIEMIKEIVSGYKDSFVAHCIGTAVKYESRAPFKYDSPLEDLKKAKKYIEFAIKHLEKNESDN